MRHRKALLLVFAAAAACLLLSPAAPARALEIGSTAPDFQLTTLDGKPIALADATRTHKAVAVIFIATKCPYSN
nr:redoxin domain-containing protein [Acidobacteriota bacterium]